MLFLFALALAAASPVAVKQHCSPTVFAPAGRYAASRLQNGPGLILSGAGLSGMPHAPVFPWIRAHFAGAGNGRAGNVLILKASGGRDYSDDFYRRGRFSSVQEVLIPPCASRSQVDAIAPYARRADVVLFSGGDQANYVRWKSSKLIGAIRAVYARGGIEGGGSAGLAVQGAVVFDSVAADRVLPDDEDVQTADAVRDPFERAISFTTNFFEWPALRDAITDTHFARRNRFGRLTAFMARALAGGMVNGPAIYGVAVDEDAVLLVDSNGMATMYQRTREADGYVPRGAWILKGERPQRLQHGRPLRYTVRVVHLQRNGDRYDLLHKRGTQRSYFVTVDGSRRPFYQPADPYR